MNNLINVYNLSQLDSINDWIYSYIKFKKIDKKIKIVINDFFYEDDLIVNENNPLFSVMCSKETCEIPLIFTDSTDEAYNFKNIDDVNISIVEPISKSCIVFDSTKYFGFANFNNVTINDQNDKYIYINVYESNDDDDSRINQINNYEIIEMNVTTNNNIVKNNTCENIETILYNLNTINSYDIIKKTKNECFINNINFKITSEYDYDYLICKYGKIAHDIIEFKTNKINESNKFKKLKIIQKIIPEDVCYWILNESEKHNNWQACEFTNHELKIDCETIPHANSYILYSLNYWLKHICGIYEIPENMGLDIKTIYITKTTRYKTNKNNNYLKCEIQLNSDFDYVGGELIEMEKKEKLKQCDMAITCNNDIYINIKQGIKYSLIILIDFIMK